MGIRSLTWWLFGIAGVAAAVGYCVPLAVGVAMYASWGFTCASRSEIDRQCGVKR